MSEVRYGIIVGINDYSSVPLEFCVKDANDIKECFTKYCKVQDKNIFELLSSRNSPRNNIHSSISEILENIKSTFCENKDSIFFYFSGHGGRSTESTKLVLKNEEISLDDLFNRCLGLSPKFMLFIIDSCYSGVGIPDRISYTNKTLYFDQLSTTATGYSILCATPHDKPAKEDKNLMNGRFTRLLIDTIRNRLNYDSGKILTLNRVYELVDSAFKNNPEFRQIPFEQTKAVSTYPLSTLEGMNEDLFFASHYISKVDDYNWGDIAKEINEYCNIENDLTNEFVRLLREIARNSLQWGEASFLKIEICNNAVTLIDNSSNRFNPFYPPKAVVINGGLKTAKIFQQNFENQYKYSLEKIDNQYIHKFIFIQIKQDIDLCKLTLSSMQDIWKISYNDFLIIPESCTNYTIIVPQGYIDLSHINLFLLFLERSVKKYKIPIILKIDDNDRLKKEFIKALKGLKNSPHKDLSISKDSLLEIV